MKIYTQKIQPDIYEKNNLVNKKLNDKETTILEDKIFYEESELKKRNIEFGSDEFYKFKNNQGKDAFPPLNAPGNVRRAWRDVTKNLSPLENFKLICRINHANLQGNILPRDITGYYNLTNSYISRFQELNKFDPNTSRTLDIDILNKFREELNKYN